MYFSPDGEALGYGRVPLHENSPSKPQSNNNPLIKMGNLNPCFLLKFRLAVKITLLEIKRTYSLLLNQPYPYSLDEISCDRF
jgi:hypothetical protein